MPRSSRLPVHALTAAAENTPTATPSSRASGFVPLLALHRRLRRGKAGRLCLGISDVDLLGCGEGIIDLNAEIPDGDLDLGMSQQQLHGT
jgi:hypothetical protein